MSAGTFRMRREAVLAAQKTASRPQAEQEDREDAAEPTQAVEDTAEPAVVKTAKPKPATTTKSVA